MRDRSAAPRLHGRADTVRELLALLDDPAVRLVTVSGRGGVGKSSVALTAAHSWTQGRPGRRAVVVGLDAGADTTLLDAVADELSVPPGPGDVADALAARFGDDDLLLLDSIERTPDAASAIAALLDRCPGLTLLVTSQTRLALRAERVLRLDPLPVPDPAAGLDRLRDEPAVALYCDRAAAVDGTFELGPDNAAAVATVCAALDGLPLAISLAAARARAIPAAEMAAQLGVRPLDVLRGPAADAPARQHDLRSTLEWTVGLLTPREELLFRRLAVVTGPFTPDVAERLLDDPADLLDLLSGLVDVHLLDPVHSPAGAWFRLPRVIAGYAAERLAASGEEGVVRRAHREGWAAWSRMAAVGAESADEALWLRAIADHHEDLVACLRSCVDDHDLGDALTLARALAPWWSVSAHHTLFEPLLESLVALGEGTSPDTDYAEVLAWQVQLVLEQHLGADPGRLDALVRRAESVARDVDADVALMRVLAAVMARSAFTADVDAAEKAGVEGLALAHALGDERWAGTFELLTAMVARLRGDDARVIDSGLRALTLARACGDRRRIVLTAMLLRAMLPAHPELVGSVPSTRECLELAGGTGMTTLQAVLTAAVTVEALGTGDVDGACSELRSALELARSAPDLLAGYALIAAVHVFAALHDAARVLWLGRVLEASWPAIGPTVDPVYAESMRARVRAVRAAAGDAVAAVADAQAEGVTLQRALVTTAQALPAPGAADAERPAAPPADARPDDLPAALTPRQREVLVLVAQGAQNREIAEALGISAKTVMHHLAAVYAAIGVRGRGEATAWAFRHGLVS